jgi:hypothetical protein
MSSLAHQPTSDNKLDLPKLQQILPLNQDILQQHPSTSSIPPTLHVPTPHLFHNSLFPIQVSKRI